MLLKKEHSGNGKLHTTSLQLHPNCYQTEGAVCDPTTHRPEMKQYGQISRQRFPDHLRWNVCRHQILCHTMSKQLLVLAYTSRVPVEGKSSVCAISMKYSNFFQSLSLSAWEKNYYHILQTHHACMHTHTPPSPFWLYLMGRCAQP